MTSSSTTNPGNKSAAELEREVQAQRAEVETTLGALQDRLSPGQLMDQLFDYARTGNGAEFTRNLGRSMRDNPIPVALMGVGMAWLMATGGRPRAARDPYATDPYADDAYDEEEWIEDDWDDRFPDRPAEPVAQMPDGSGSYVSTDPLGTGGEAGDDKGLMARAGEAAEELKGRVGEAGEQAGAALREGGEAAARYGRRMRRKARHYRDDLGHVASRYGRRARRGLLDTLEEQPLVLGAIGIAIGAALGAALPATAREDEMMGDTRDRLKHGAVDAAKEQVDKARDMASAAYEAASEEADRQGLTPEAGETAARSFQDKAAKVAEAAKTAAEKEAMKG